MSFECNVIFIAIAYWRRSDALIDGAVTCQTFHLRDPPTTTSVVNNEFYKSGLEDTSYSVVQILQNFNY
jgi:hypothetical protein